MSEPCSFFLRVSIEKSRYLQFMQAQPSQPLVNDNWRKWWESRQMHAHPDLDEEIGAWKNERNQDIVDDWLNAQETFAFSDFNEATSTWEFGIMMCSENYSEILPLLVFCESLSAYKTPSTEDFSIIYPYFWGDSYVMAYASYSQDGLLLSLANSVTEVDKNHLDYAALRLDKKWNEFDANR